MASPIFTFFPKQRKNTSASSFYAQNLPKSYSTVANCSDSFIPVNESEQLATVEYDLQDENVKLKAENVQLKAEIEELRKQNAKKQNDLKNLLKLQKETCRMYVNSEMKYKVLKKSVNLQSHVLYESFKNDFDENVLKQLRKIQGERNRDSTFILICMRELCKDIGLNSITAKGTRRGRPSQLEIPKEKSPLPMEKREIIDNIFLERLASEKLNDGELSERYVLLNRHINVAITNIKKTNVSFFGLHFVFNVLVALH